MVSRWLLGFCFSKHDLELLDDPIPDALYCKPCRDKHRKSKPLQLESGTTNSVDTLGSSAQEVVMMEPLGSELDRSSFQHNDDSFNLTHEVDKCDLWRNMVRGLDAPMPSPRDLSRTSMPADSTDMTSLTYSDGAWHHSVTRDTSLPLATLEECDTELESQAQLDSPNFGNVALTPGFSPKDIPSPSYPGSTSSPKYPQLESHACDRTHQPVSSTADTPQYFSYQSTSV